MRKQNVDLNLFSLSMFIIPILQANDTQASHRHCKENSITAAKVTKTQRNDQDPHRIHIEFHRGWQFPSWACASLAVRTISVKESLTVGPTMFANQGAPWLEGGPSLENSRRSPLRRRARQSLSQIQDWSPCLARFHKPLHTWKTKPDRLLKHTLNWGTESKHVEDFESCLASWLMTTQCQCLCKACTDLYSKVQMIDWGLYPPKSGRLWK